MSLDSTQVMDAFADIWKRLNALEKEVFQKGSIPPPPPEPPPPPPDEEE